MVLARSRYEFSVSMTDVPISSICRLESGESASRSVRRRIFFCSFMYGLFDLYGTCLVFSNLLAAKWELELGIRASDGVPRKVGFFVHIVFSELGGDLDYE